MSPQPLRAAASVVLWRYGPQGPEAMMGQRGATARFLPSKLVFPGGAVDPRDLGAAPVAELSETCRARLAIASTLPPDALTACGLRELREETGIDLIGPPGVRLHFLFRAITPPDRPHRFDARFFLVAAPPGLTGPGAGDGELTGLGWVPLAAFGAAPLPFVTELVVAEAQEAIARGHPPDLVGFYDNRDAPQIRRLPGTSA